METHFPDKDVSVSAFMFSDVTAASLQLHWEHVNRTKVQEKLMKVERGDHQIGGDGATRSTAHIIREVTG